MTQDAYTLTKLHDVNKASLGCLDHHSEYYVTIPQEVFFAKKTFVRLFQISTDFHIAAIPNISTEWVTFSHHVIMIYSQFLRNSSAVLSFWLAVVCWLWLFVKFTGQYESWLVKMADPNAVLIGFKAALRHLLNIKSTLQTYK